MVFSAADDAPPFRIVNRSQVDLTFHQEGVAQIAELSAGSTCSYAWDDLSKEQKLVLCVKDAPYSNARTYDLHRIYVGDKLLYPQFFHIIGPSSLVLGGVRNNIEPNKVVKPVLCTRHLRNPMQLWQMTPSGRLRNKAGFILELTVAEVSGNEEGTENKNHDDTVSVDTVLQLRRVIAGEESASEFQRWEFFNGALRSMTTDKHCVTLQCSDRYCSPTAGDVVCAVPISACDDTGVPSSTEFSRHFMPPGSGTLAVRVVADGPTRVLIVTDAAEKDSAVQVSVNNSGTEDWTSDVTIELPEGIGLSVVDTEEIAYVSLDGIRCQLSQSDLIQRISFSVDRIQVQSILFIDPVFAFFSLCYHFNIG